jgi:hypothetical protein
MNIRTLNISSSECLSTTSREMGIACGNEAEGRKKHFVITVTDSASLQGWLIIQQVYNAHCSLVGPRQETAKIG